MKYLKKFNLHTDYETFMGSQDLIYPNVSYCVDRSEVHFNPDPYNGHKFVDLGLPSGTLWATTNIGANSPEEYGLYFQWGDTQGYTADQVGTGSGQKAFKWTDYKYSNNGGSTAADMTKYNSTDGKMVLDIEDDAARVNWGEKWCMPTKEQGDELLNTQYVTSTFITEYNGNRVNGFLLTSVSNGNTMFIPAAGSCERGVVLDGDSSIWTSTLYPLNVKSALFFCFGVDGTIATDIDRYCGYSIRPVVYIEPMK